MPADLNKLREQPLTAIQALPSGGRAWEQGMRQAIAQGHTAAYLAAIKDRTGVMPKGLSRAERAELKAQVERQLKFFDKFVQDMPHMSPAQIAARAAMYAGAGRGTYYGARYPGLPFHPADGGTACKSNCRCSWKDNGDGSYNYVLGVAEHCADCESRAAGSPYKVAA